MPMKIGLLECDHVAPRRRHIGGDYREMFDTMLTRDGPDQGLCLASALDRSGLSTARPLGDAPMLSTDIRAGYDAVKVRSRGTEVV